MKLTDVSNLSFINFSRCVLRRVLLKEKGVNYKKFFLRTSYKFSWVEPATDVIKPVARMF